MAYSQLRIRTRILPSMLLLAWLLGAPGFCQETRPAVQKDVPHLAVTGTALDSNEKPVPDAEVYLPIFGGSGGTRLLTTRTNQMGVWEFKLDQQPTGDIVVLASKPGYGLGVAKKDDRPYWDDDDIHVGDTVHLAVRLGEPSRQSLRVVDHEGMPVAGARLGLIAISHAKSMAFYWEEPHVPQLSWETAADGSVTLDKLEAAEAIVLLVETKQQGVQFLNAPVNKTGETVVKLLPLCQVEVVLSSNDASVAKNREIKIDSRAAQDTDQAKELPAGTRRPWGGRARIRTDDAGRAMATVPAGSLSVVVSQQKGDRFFADAVPETKAEPAQTVRLKVGFKPGTKLTGIVQSPEGQPIANIGFQFVDNEVSSRDDGTFETWIPADRPAYGHVRHVPDQFALPYDRQIYVPVPDPKNAGKASTEDTRKLPPVILRKAVPISGRVTDENGQPVASAHVIASWVQRHESEGYFTLKSASTKSNANGQFRLTRVYPDVDVIVTAQTADKCVLEATALHSTAPQDLQLTVSASGMVPIVGSVKGSDNRDVTNAIVKISRAMVAPGGHVYGNRPVEWNDQSEFAAESNGSFQSPGRVPRFGKYSVTISAEGYLAVESKFLAPMPTDPSLNLGITKLTKARSIAGTVRDTSGTPVSGAQVWSWAASSDGGRSHTERTTATTDAAGRFTLTKLHPAAALAFVKKDGCRFTGCALPTNSTEILLSLFRTDEVIPEARAVEPANLNNPRRFAAADSLLKEILLDQQNSNYFHGEIMSMLARSNPMTARTELSKTTSADTRAKTFAQLGDVPDALAEVELINDPYSRAYCRFALIDFIKDADEIRNLLAAAVLDAQAIARPDRRAVVVASIVEQFSRLGDHKQVAALLREELPRVTALSTKEWAGFARGNFAAQLARTDPKTALQIASEAPADEQTRYYMNIAHVLASTNPDAAEEALRKIGKHRYVDDPAVRVAYRMAAVDLPRALRLVEQIDGQWRATEKARGFGVMAWALRNTDKQRARELLQRAFESIPEQIGGGGSRTDDIFGAGMELLRLAEEVDREKLTDYFWKAASLHPGPNGGAWSPDDAPRENAESQARLGLLLSLYTATPEVLEQIIAPVFQFWESQIGSTSHRFTDHTGSFTAMALIHPERAADWAQRFHEKLAKEDRRYIPQPWEVVGNALTKDRQAIGESVTRKVFHRWVIDQFDP